jgi:hypothetical protein
VSTSAWSGKVEKVVACRAATGTLSVARGGGATNGLVGHHKAELYSDILRTIAS